MLSHNYFRHIPRSKIAFGFFASPFGNLKASFRMTGRVAGAVGHDRPCESPEGFAHVLSKLLIINLFLPPPESLENVSETGRYAATAAIPSNSSSRIYGFSANPPNPASGFCHVDRKTAPCAPPGVNAATKQPDSGRNLATLTEKRPPAPLQVSTWQQNSRPRLPHRLHRHVFRPLLYQNALYVQKEARVAAKRLIFNGLLIILCAKSAEDYT